MMTLFTALTSVVLEAARLDRSHDPLELDRAELKRTGRMPVEKHHGKPYRWGKPDGVE